MFEQSIQVGDVVIRQTGPVVEVLHRYSDSYKSLMAVLIIDRDGVVSFEPRWKREQVHVEKAEEYLDRFGLGFRWYGLRTLLKDTKEAEFSAALWRVVRGYRKASGIGKVGRKELRKKLVEAGIPEPDWKK